MYTHKKEDFCVQQTLQKKREKKRDVTKINVTQNYSRLLKAESRTKKTKSGRGHVIT